MLCIGYGREAAARRMRGLSPRREPLIRLAFGKAPSPTRGEGREGYFFVSSIGSTFSGVA
jgi:hypothetical protein